MRSSWARSGAHLASEIKFAGWDGLYIKGRAKKPVWLSVVNDKVEFKDASKMWGKTTDEAHEGSTAFLEKRSADYRKYPRRP